MPINLYSNSILEILCTINYQLKSRKITLFPFQTNSTWKEELNLPPPKRVDSYFYVRCFWVWGSGDGILMIVSKCQTVTIWSSYLLFFWVYWWSFTQLTTYCLLVSYIRFCERPHIASFVWKIWRSSVCLCRRSPQQNATSLQNHWCSYSTCTTCRL